MMLQKYIANCSNYLFNTAIPSFRPTVLNSSFIDEITSRKNQMMNLSFLMKLLEQKTTAHNNYAG